MSVDGCSTCCMVHAPSSGSPTLLSLSLSLSPTLCLIVCEYSLWSLLPCFLLRPSCSCSTSLPSLPFRSNFENIEFNPIRSDPIQSRPYLTSHPDLISSHLISSKSIESNRLDLHSHPPSTSPHFTSTRPHRLSVFFDVSPPQSRPINADHQTNKLT